MLNQFRTLHQNLNLEVSDWHDTNRRYLAASLNELRLRLAQLVKNPSSATAHEAELAEAQQTIREANQSLTSPSALENLGEMFGLSPFERDLLLLCAGVELDASFATLYAAAQGDAQRSYPTFSLALSLLPDAHWSALTPIAPLRRWRLIEVSASGTAGGNLLFSPLRIDERVLHFLLGVYYLDDRLAGLIEPIAVLATSVASHRAIAERIATLWAQGEAGTPSPVVQLCGRDGADVRSIAATVCHRLGIGLYGLSATTLPSDPRELDALMRLWEREATLSHAALLLDCDDADRTDTLRLQAATRFIEQIGGLLLVSGRERYRLCARPLFYLDVYKPTAQEQRGLWQAALGSTAASLNGRVEPLIAQFSLNANAIYSAARRANQAWASQPAKQTEDESVIDELLWDACRLQSRSRLDELAQQINVQATWDDLVLPEAQRQTLHDLVTQIRQRATVYEQWGFASKSARGLGISALFAGVSGTGKTMAAEVLAHELRLDLYRIDLSQVVSKYIGETEKNLRRVFDAAEEGGAVLLFDEADALFGKRSEVKDSHDRYANIEVSYLLQRMEAYRGLAILTTNLKNALDTAFLRRIRFIIPFPFPDAMQRSEIWRRIFPAATPTDGLDVGRLARLNVAGGNIRNIALTGAFLAAEAGEPVRMSHLLRAAQIEYAKLEKSLTAGEVGDWVTG